MIRVLVLGGYGVFGRRAVERLVRDPNLHVIVAGRDAQAAATLAATMVGPTMAGTVVAGRTGRISHARLDALTLTGDDLRRLSVGILINTVGPFQAHDYRVAQACIDAGAHYIDLADARAFVTGITQLDAEARKADVLVTSGASSVPALAAAVIDAELAGSDRLETIRYGISPGNSFDPGTATVASIIGAVGRPFQAWIEGRWQTRYGWQPLQAHRFPGIGSRWFGACDIPDLDLFPARYPGLKSQQFMTGLEVKAFHAGVWALSWLARAGVIRHPEKLAKPLLAAKRLMPWIGSDRGTMFIELTRREDNGRPRQTHWHLIGSSGHGPFVPTIPAVIIARKLAAGLLDERGAKPCLGLITLDDVTREVADLDIRQWRSEVEPLYRRALGRDFESLPREVRRLHEVRGAETWLGEADVERGTHWLARLIATLFGLPPSGPAQPLQVRFTPEHGTEIWERRFGQAVFRSRQTLGARSGAAVIEEDIGPARLTLIPEVTSDALCLSAGGLRVFGIPMPRLLVPRVTTRETVANGRYRFDVEAQVAGIGRLIRYTGWLERTPD